MDCDTRQLDDSWILRDYAGHAVVQLGPIAEGLPLAKIYEGVEPSERAQ